MHDRQGNCSNSFLQNTKACCFSRRIICKLWPRTILYLSQQSKVDWLKNKLTFFSCKLHRKNGDSNLLLLKVNAFLSQRGLFHANLVSMVKACMSDACIWQLAINGWHHDQNSLVETNWWVEESKNKGHDDDQELLPRGCVSGAQFLPEREEYNGKI